MSYLCTSNYTNAWYNEMGLGRTGFDPMPDLIFCYGICYGMCIEYLMTCDKGVWNF